MGLRLLRRDAAAVNTPKRMTLTLTPFLRVRCRVAEQEDFGLSPGAVSMRAPQVVSNAFRYSLLQLTSLLTYLLFRSDAKKIPKQKNSEEPNSALPLDTEEIQKHQASMQKWQYTPYFHYERGAPNSTPHSRESTAASLDFEVGLGSDTMLSYPVSCLYYTQACPGARSIKPHRWIFAPPIVTTSLGPVPVCLRSHIETSTVSSAGHTVGS